MLYGLICCLFGIPCIYSCTFRAKLRNKYGLPDAPAPDWITHCFCEYCALCQEYRELKNRGLDPSIGNTNHSQIIQLLIFIMIFSIIVFDFSFMINFTYSLSMLVYIGWIGNVQKQRMGQPQEMMAPPMGQRMMG